jgi:hypothetical protein
MEFSFLFTTEVFTSKQCQMLRVMLRVRLPLYL